ncbi:MAG: hypothetical protein OXD43_08010, partial [Bacteroidetes bacterium]|nr:hypothetical protein [Bacteroidota bacterium]
TKPFCEKTREIWVKTHEFGAKSALLDGKMGKMSTEISNSSNGVAKMGSVSTGEVPAVGEGQSKKVIQAVLKTLSNKQKKISSCSMSAISRSAVSVT